MSDENLGPGYDTPELAAIGDIPRRYCRVIASAVNNDIGYVLLDTGTEASPYPYGVHCFRHNGRWYEGSSGNGSSWELIDEGSGRGVLAYWEEAPPNSDAASIRFEGNDYEVPVVHGYFLFTRSDAPEEPWPVVRGFRINGKWKTKSDRAIRREQKIYERMERRMEAKISQVEAGETNTGGMGAVDE